MAHNGTQCRTTTCTHVRCTQDDDSTNKQARPKLCPAPRLLAHALQACSWPIASRARCRPDRQSCSPST
eukprot:11551450-Alexandrium_andersonii.AAC.1